MLVFHPIKARIEGNLFAKLFATVPIARAKVPGGWLVAFHATVCFVPDPDHFWDGSSLPELAKERAK